MPPDVPEHRLAAILSADVAGYSRLMAQNEDETVRALTAYRDQVAALVAEHGGRVADFTGDNFLVEFSSAQQAVRCAVEIQRVLAARNADVPLDRKLEFRMGIHLGDVRVEGEQIFGDGVNIAARLEGLADAGGICISRAVHEQVEGKLELQYQSVGAQRLKNIPHPVHAYRVALGVPPAASKARGRHRPVALVAVALLSIVSALALWRWTWPGSSTDPASYEKGAPIASLAVLPLENLSGDPGYEYFADGMTDALIADLSKIASLRVISRTSVMQYKGTRKSLPEIGRELNVEAVVEGSVLRSGDRVRIVAQLVHARDDRHLWAESYERDLGDIIAMQREVAQAIVREIRATLTSQEQTRLTSFHDVPADAYDAYLKGRFHWNILRSQRSRADGERAMAYFERTIELAPDSALGYAGLAAVYDTLGTAAFLSPAEVIRGLGQAAQRALELDDTLAEVHTAMGDYYWWTWDWDKVEPEYLRAIELNPSFVTGHSWRGYWLVSSGRIDEAIAEYEFARQLDPLSASAAGDLCLGLFLARRYAQSEHWCKEMMRRNEGAGTAQETLSVLYSLGNRHEEAVATARSAVELTGRSDGALRYLGYAHARAGNRDRAVEIVEELIERSRDRYVDPTYLAIVYASLGDLDESFEWLEKAFQTRAFDLTWTLVGPMFDSLRGDPRFDDLVHRIGRNKG